MGKHYGHGYKSGLFLILNCVSNLGKTKKEVSGWLSALNRWMLPSRNQSGCLETPGWRSLCVKKVREEKWTDHGAQPKALQIDCSGSWQQIVRSFSVFSLILGNLSKVLVVGVHNPNERVQNLLNLPTNPEISLCCHSRFSSFCCYI